MDAVYPLHDVLAALGATGQSYHEFLDAGTLSCGVYHLAAGEPDRQQPHQQDEVYYVLSGSGRITIDGAARDVRPGDTIFVGRHVPHHFHDYPEGITLLVIFAPSRSRGGASAGG